MRFKKCRRCKGKFFAHAFRRTVRGDDIEQYVGFGSHAAIVEVVLMDHVCLKCRIAINEKKGRRMCDHLVVENDSDPKR